MSYYMCVMQRLIVKIDKSNKMLIKAEAVLKIIGLVTKYSLMLQTFLLM